MNDLLQLKTHKTSTTNAKSSLENLTGGVITNSSSSSYIKTTNTTTTTITTNTSSSNNYDTTLLQYLFTLLMFKESRLQACQLIESILLHMPMLNLNRINNIKLILENIDDDGLSCICKIFAVTLSNLDMNEKKYLASGQKRIQIQKQRAAAAAAASSSSSQQAFPTSSSAPTPTVSPTTSAANSTEIAATLPSTSSVKTNTTAAPALPLSIRDQNQELLLKIPTLLFRLVNLVRRKDYAIRYSDANSEIEHWIRYIDQALSDTEDANDMATTSSPLRRQSTVESGATAAAATSRLG